MSINQKAVLRVNSDGDVVKCAKGLPAADCGWKPGDKVCGACGAMAVMTKGGRPDPSRAAHHMGKPGAHDPADADFGVGMEREMDEEVADEDQIALRKRPTRNMPQADPAEVREVEDTAEEGNPEEMSEDTEDELQRQARIKKYRKMRMGGMGIKDAVGDEGSFLCGVSRKVLNAGSEPCDGCSGGCFPVKGMPDLLAVEGMAQEMFGGKVLDSGYSGQYDTFVVDVRRKDGKLIEAYFNGMGESEGWHPIPEGGVTGGDDIIGGDEAIISALAEIQGKALDLGVQLVGGQPAYRVEVDGADGYSYDVFVGMNGKVLGIDQYEYDTSVLPQDSVKGEPDDIAIALMEFEALSTEAELRDQGLI